VKTRKKNQTNTHRVTSREEARLAYERVAPKLATLAPGEILKLNLNIAKTVEHVLVAQRAILEIIPDLQNRIVDFPVDQVRELRDLALAVWHAEHAPPAKAEHAKVRELVEEGMTLRRTLLLEAEALVALEEVNEDQVQAVRGGRGHRNIATGLEGLARLFRERWEDIAAKTAVTTKHLERAENLSVELLYALGGRRLAIRKEKRQDMELRALTLLVQSYDEIRAAVIYVRWKEKDADEIAPSLFGGRTRRRPLEQSSPPATPSPATPAVPATPPVT
jgi:hypothetical protein